MKTKLLLALTLGVLPCAQATNDSRPDLAPGGVSVVDDSAGLLGRTYSALEFGYTHHVESAPRTLRRWGFVSNRPLVEEARNVDAAFRYNYTRGSAAGVAQTQHDVAVSFAGYLPLPEARPFVRADVGWSFARGRGNSENAFMYVVGGGVELPIRARVTVTPYLNYQDAPDFDADAFVFGARAAYRFDRGWLGTFAIQVDDKHNIEYALGAVRRF